MAEGHNCIASVFEISELRARIAELEAMGSRWEQIANADLQSIADLELEVRRLSAENSALRIQNDALLADGERIKFIDWCGFLFESDTRRFTISMQLPMSFPGLPLKASTAIDAARGGKS